MSGFCFLVYLFTVLWYTVLKRELSYQGARFELFWSYRKWLAGDAKLGREIMANMAMFLPFGFLMGDLLSVPSRKARAAFAAASAGLFSLTIEMLQLYFMRGLCEWDDVISNTAGAVLGLALYCALARLLRNRKSFRALTASAGLVFIIVCASVFYTERGDAGIRADSSSRGYCFQIDEAVLDGEKLQVTGFCFCYEHPEWEPSVFLRSTETGEEVKLSTEYGISRPDVNDTFLCDKDYSHTGFTAEGTVEPDTEYEVRLHWKWMSSGYTGVFITGDEVHYAENASFTAPDTAGTDLEEIVSKGTLRVYRPDRHCWVYQLGWNLYWIVDSNFSFEEDGSTYIQYQLWTTQTQNLPEKRLAHGNYWDNIGGHFEKYELEGDFGQYRVMKRAIPKEYSVTAIVTGYYKNGAWVWKNYFRPVY